MASRIDFWWPLMFLSWASRLSWFVEHSADERHVMDTENLDWYSKRWHCVPTTRFAWGELQSQLHEGAPELILDLIFVGIAYRVGVVIKDAIYACVPDSREAYDAGEPMCIGVWLSLLHGLAPFVATFQIWSYATAMKARYATSSKVHTLMDLTSNLVRTPYA